MKQSRKIGKSTLQTLICCDILPGLKPFVCQELQNRFGSRVILHASDDPDNLFMHFNGDLRDLFALRTVAAVYMVLPFAIPRPRALLGHQHYHLLLQKINEVRRLHATATFTSLRLSAAGENSTTFIQLMQQLSRDCDLPVDAEDGDLLLRIRPSSYAENGWEVLIRLTPRPLATRSWRVFNMKGALNATVASTMVELARPRSTDRVLNLMCGSGTLLVERLQRCPAALAAGCDLNIEALHGAQANLERGGIVHNVLLFASDVTDLPFLPGTFTTFYADVPWGQLTGSHEENKMLYPRLLSEAARIAAPQAQFILLTHEITLFEEVLPQFRSTWETQQVLKIFQGGLHPRIYVLQRNE